MAKVYHYDFKTKTTTVTNYGHNASAAKADYDKATSSYGSSETNTPKVIEPATEEERTANQKIYTTQERNQISTVESSLGRNLSSVEKYDLVVNNVSPSNWREEARAKANELSLARAEAAKNKTIQYTGQQGYTGQQINEKQGALLFGTQKDHHFIKAHEESWYEQQYSKLSEELKGSDMSDFSIKVYEKSTGISSDIYSIASKLEEYGLAGKALSYPIRSLASYVPIIGKAPGGLEVMVDNPKALSTVLPLAAYQATVGTYEAFKEDPLQTISDIATLAILTGGVVRGAKYAPKINRANLVSIEGAGSTPTLASIDVGYQASVLNKPIVTYIPGKGLSKGAGSAPAELLEGKTVTAFSNSETSLFRNTVEDVGGPVEGQYFNAGYDIAAGISKTKKPVVEPESFKIVSENVPDAAKPIVEESIRTYKGDIEVYGSSSQKLQMGDYMSRSPQDIEVVVDNPAKFVSTLEAGFQDTGIKYSVKGLESGKPKVEFITDDGLAVKGIEIFGKSTPAETTGGYKPGSDIAYGFSSRKPIIVDDVKMMGLSEQGPRKFAGGTVLKDGQIEPVHPGRMKDVGDLIEIGSAFEIEQGIGIESSLVKYSQIAKQKGASSPVMDFIAGNKRVPTKTEFTDILGDPAEIVKLNSPDLLYSSSRISNVSSLPRSARISSLFLASQGRSSPPSSARKIKDQYLSSIQSPDLNTRSMISQFNSNSRSPLPGKSAVPSIIPSPSRSSTNPSSKSSSLVPSSPPTPVPAVMYIPEVSMPAVKTPRQKRRSRELDIFDIGIRDRNLHNKYNDPLKVAAAIDADVQKMLRRR